MRRGSRRFRRVLLWCLPGIALGLASGCRTDDAAEADWARGREVRPGTAAEWAVFAEAQAGRLDTLSSFSSNGSLVLDSRDEEGRPTTNRLNHRLWRVAPDKAAVRLSVSGITIGRLGWNGLQWWMLNEDPDPPELMVVDMEASPVVSTRAEETMSPPVMLFLIGLIPFPAEPPVDFMVAGDRASFTLDSIRWPIGDGALTAAQRHRIVVGQPARGPIGIEVLDDAEEPLSSITLGRFEPVETLGSPPGAWPDLPHRVEVVSRGAVFDRLVITFDGPLARGRISERLFSLPSLIERVDPVVLDDRGFTSQKLLDVGGEPR
ncbi:MAG: hypothetical protein CMJ34_11825 [Phycisphaerae bacterium]|nr:hypothetical protein [Phycisphaerae bacterium]